LLKTEFHAFKWEFVMYFTLLALQCNLLLFIAGEVVKCHKIDTKCSHVNVKLTLVLRTKTAKSLSLTSCILHNSAIIHISVKYVQ